MLKKILHQFKNLRQRRVRLGRLLDERGGIAGLLQFQNILADRAMCFAQLHLAQGVQLGTAAAAEGKIRRVKQIQFSSER